MIEIFMGKGWWIDGGGSSEGCLRWGGGSHQGISPKTSQNRGWGQGGHFIVKKTGGLAR